LKPRNIGLLAIHTRIDRVFRRNLLVEEGLLGIRDLFINEGSTYQDCEESHAILKWVCRSPSLIWRKKLSVVRELILWEQVTCLPRSLQRQGSYRWKPEDLI
jgi:hypothetical protein